jgi:NAD-dependent deacetylase
MISPDLIKILREARFVTVLTGAGISAESGIPTFREAQTGLWEKYRPEDLATLRAFRVNPQLVWNWYQWRRKLISEAKPNPGHYALVQMQKHLSGFSLITQNVDGLHQSAGSTNVIELHGNIMRNKCFYCDKEVADSIPNTEDIPQCQRCGGTIRPDVVWYGESLPPKTIQSAWEATENCDVFFTIGTSALVQPAASFPTIALQNNATVIEINPHKTPFSDWATYHLQSKSGEILPLLVEKTWNCELHG